MAETIPDYPPVELSEEACKALRQEMRREIDSATGEYHGALHRGIGGPEYADRMRKRILACAELLGQLECSHLRWRDGEVVEVSTAPLSFSQDVMAWLAEDRRLVAEQVPELDLHPGVPVDDDHHARQAFLLHLLDRIVDGDTRVGAGEAI